MSGQLEEYCELISGRHIPVKQYNTDSRGMGYLTGPSDFGPLHPVVSKWSEHPQSTALPGDILITVKGSGVGKINLLNGEEVAISRQLMAIRPKDINPRFLYLFIDSKFEHFQSKANGAAIPGISRDDVLELELPPFSLAEQKRIVSILDEAFSAIAKAKENAEKNLLSARELFESYLNRVFTQQGPGWQETDLSKICSIESKLVDPRDPEHIDLPHIGAGNMVSQSDELEDVLTAREEGLISNKYGYDTSMVLYSKIRPYLMKVSRPSFDGLCSADVYPLKPVAGTLERDFLFYILLSKPFTDYAIAGSARAGMPKVNRKHLFAYNLAIPAVEEQRRLTASIGNLSSEARRLETIYTQKLANLDELRQVLLQKAFTGQLTMREQVAV